MGLKYPGEQRVMSQKSEDGETVGAIESEVDAEVEVENVQKKGRSRPKK